MPAGRPTKYSKEITEEICNYIREGYNLKDASALAGVGETTRCRWENQYREFRKALDEAELEWKGQRIKRVQAGGVRVTGKGANAKVSGDWKADMALLKARFKDEFSDKHIHDVSHSIDSGMENAFRLIDALVDAAKSVGKGTKRKSR